MNGARGDARDDESVDGSDARAAARPLSIATVARQFDHRAARLAGHDVLLREVGERLVSRLEYIHLRPRRMLDVGCGLRRMRARLQALHPQAEWTGVELSGAVAHAGRRGQQREQGSPACGARRRNGSSPTAAACPWPRAASTLSCPT